MYVYTHIHSYSHASSNTPHPSPYTHTPIHTRMHRRTHHALHACAYILAHPPSIHTHTHQHTHTRVVHRTIEPSLPSANEINPLRLINYNVYYVHWPKASNTRSFTYFLDRSSAIHPCAQITRSSETLTQWSKYQKSKYQKPIPLQLGHASKLYHRSKELITVCFNPLPYIFNPARFRLSISCVPVKRKLVLSDRCPNREINIDQDIYSSMKNSHDLCFLYQKHDDSFSHD